MSEHFRQVAKNFDKNVIKIKNTKRFLSLSSLLEYTQNFASSEYIIQFLASPKKVFLLQ